MKIIYSPKFLKHYKKIPKNIKLQAENREKIFRKNPFDMSLKTHKLKGRLNSYWSFSIDYQYRIVFEIVSNKEVWFLDIGTHEIY